MIKDITTTSNSEDVDYWKFMNEKEYRYFKNTYDKNDSKVVSISMLVEDYEYFAGTGGNLLEEGCVLDRI